MKYRFAILIAAAALAALAPAQDRGRDRDRDRDRSQDRYSGDTMTRLQPGTLIPVRTNEIIDANRRDNLVYRGIVDQDVRGDNGRLAIPRGSTVELIVRTDRNNDLIIDLESVMVNGQRYAVRTDPNRVQTEGADNLIGSIIGAISGGEGRGPSVRIPRDSIVSFRLQRPLDMGVADRGLTRDGRHYHDYYDRQDRDRQDRNQ